MLNRCASQDIKNSFDQDTQKDEIEIIIKNLSNACLHLYENNELQAASIIWHAIFKAASYLFLSAIISSEFLLATTRQLLPLINRSALDESARLIDYLIKEGLIPKKASALYGLLAEVNDQFKNLKDNLAENANLIVSQENFDSQIKNLVYCTSSYQAAVHLSNSAEECANAAIKITAYEKKFLTDYYLKAWLAYWQLIDKSPEWLTKENYIQALSWLSDMVTREFEKKQSAEKNQPDWQRYSDNLKDLRQKLYKDLPSLPFAKLVEVDKVVQAQRSYSQEIRDFLASLFDDCKSILGEIGCAFGIFGVGSLSRDEAVPFSDFEYIIVIESNLPREKRLLVNTYLSVFLQLFAFKIQSLGESGTHGDIKGLHIDDGLALSPNFKSNQIIGAVGTIEEIFRDNTFGGILKGQIYSLLHPVYITGSHDGPFSHNDATGHSLFKDYQDYVQNFLELGAIRNLPAPSLNHRQHFAFAWLEEHRKELAEQLKQPLADNPLTDIKERYLAPLSHIAFDLAYYFDLPIANQINKVTHSIEVWEALKEYFDPATIKAAKYFMATAFVTRILIQKHYGQQLKPELLALSFDVSVKVLEQFDLITQLRRVYPYPTVEHFYYLKEQAICDQFFLHETLLMRPLLFFLQKLNLSQPLVLEKYDFLVKNFKELLQQVTLSEKNITLAKFINYLIKYLIYTEAKPITYITIYQQLLLERAVQPEEAQLVFVEQLIKVNKTNPSELLTNIIAKLIVKPNPEDVLAIYEGRQDSPAQGLKELQQSQSKRTEEILHLLLAGKTEGLARLEQLSARQKLLIIQEINQTSRIGPEKLKPLTAGKLLSRLFDLMATIEFTELDLTAFGDVLTDRQLIKILKNTAHCLKVLDISACTRFTQMQLTAILQELASAPALTKLYLNGFASLQKINIKLPLLFGQPPFPNLKMLSVRQANQLKSCVLYAPRLKSLDLSGCSAIQTLELTTENLKRIIFYQTSAIKNMSIYAPKLKQVDIILNENSQEIDRKIICEALKNCTLAKKEQKQNVDNPIREIRLKVPETSQLSKYDYIIKIVMLGSYSGQSSLLSRFTEGKFLERIPPCPCDIGSKIIEINNIRWKLQIWDANVQGEVRAIQSSYFRGSHVVLIAYNIADRYSFENIYAIWNSEVFKRYVIDESIPILLIGCQADLSHEREISEEEGLAAAKKIGAVSFFECSAKTGANVDEVFYSAVHAHLKMPGPIPASTRSIKQQYKKYFSRAEIIINNQEDVSKQPILSLEQTALNGVLSPAVAKSDVMSNELAEQKSAMVPVDNHNLNYQGRLFTLKKPVKEVSLLPGLAPQEELLSQLKQALEKYIEFDNADKHLISFLQSEIEQIEQKDDKIRWLTTYRDFLQSEIDKMPAYTATVSHLNS